MPTYGEGRDFLVKLGDGGVTEVFTTVGGMRTTAMAINQTQIDVTNKDDADWRTMISGGIHSMSLTLAGVMSDDTQLSLLKDMALATDGSDIANFQLISGLGDIYQGPFQVVSIESAGDVGKEETYSLKLESAGRIEKVA